MASRIKCCLVYNVKDIRPDLLCLVYFHIHSKSDVLVFEDYEHKKLCLSNLAVVRQVVRRTCLTTLDRCETGSFYSTHEVLLQ